MKYLHGDGTKVPLYFFVIFEVETYYTVNDRHLIAGLALLFMMLFVRNLSFGQETAVEGFIREENTNEPLRFAHVFFKGTGTGTTSDTTGYFRLTIGSGLKKTDSITVTYLGYQAKTVAIQPNVHQTITVHLRSEFTRLQEVTVNYDDNPAFPILDKVIEKKKQNNPDSRRSYSCEEYSKIRFDLNHLTESLKKNFLLRPFEWIWENADTTSDGVSYLPVLLVEKQVEHYYQAPDKKRDVVKAINSTGLKGPKIMQFVNDLYATPNLYDNFVTILEKNFPSPIHDHYKNHYYYYLEDSVMEENEKVYIISFYPKFNRQLAFTGSMRIDAESHALRQIDVRFDIFTNVNFVRSYWVSQRYAKIDGQYWMPSASQVIGDFTVAENSAEFTGFFGRKNSTYTHYRVDLPISDKKFRGSEITVQADSADLRTEAYWKSNRHTALTEEENGVFNMVKKLEDDPAFVLRKNLILALVTGYVPVKKTEIGNFYSFYSYNKVEHSRLKFGFRTNRRYNLPVDFSAYTAYGFYDEKWKYAGDFSWNVSHRKKRPNRLGISYKYDIEQLSRSFNNIEIDHVLASFVQYGGTSSRNYVTDVNAYIESSPVIGLLGRLNYFNNTISPTGSNQFLETGSDIPVADYTATGVGVTLKYSWQNNGMTGSFYTSEKKNYFRKYPDIAIQWKWADRGIFNSGVNFQKINIQVWQNIRMNKLGYTRYYLEIGRTFGMVPYPYLNIPFANQLVFHDDYAFNLMNFLEYASDRFVTAHVHHHFDGLIFDRIPLLNRLKWRSLIFARAWWGGISHANNAEHYQFAENLHGLNKGYFEAGFGIENIFKIARMDFTWRLTDTNQKGVYAFIVKPSFKFSF